MFVYFCLVIGVDRVVFEDVTTAPGFEGLYVCRFVGNMWLL